MNLETDPENNNQLNAVITEQNVDQKHFDDSIKIYSLIECSISEIQRSEWLNFKEVKKELLKFKHVQNESNNVYICYFKPMEFNCDFYHWIAKIILSKSFDLYSDYIRSETEFEYFTDKLRFQEILKPYAKFPLNLLPSRSYPCNRPHDQGVRINQNMVFLQHNGVFALYLLE
jgi:hypothetical protein